MFFSLFNGVGWNDRRQLKRVGYAYYKTKVLFELWKLERLIKFNVEYIQIIIMKQGFTERFKK